MAEPATTTSDWPVEAADAIERAVGTVRDATTTKALTVGRAVVYGMFAAIVAITAIVLAAIGAARVLNVYLPDAVFGETHMWAAHLITGAVFTVIGLLALRLGRRPPDEEQP
jgi:hypothetical protein